MTSVDTAQDQSVLWNLDFDAELPCQSSHVNTPCTGFVVGIKTRECVVGSFVICQNSYNWNTGIIADHSRVCDNCGKRAGKCWSIRPI